MVADGNVALVIYYSLKVTDSHGSCFECRGSEEVMRAAQTEFADAMEAPDGTGKKYVRILGITDTCDRAEHELIIKTEDIIAISLWKLD